MELLSTEYCKTKTKVIILANPREKIGVPEGTFLKTITKKKHQFTQARNHFFADHVYIGLCNEPKRLLFL